MAYSTVIADKLHNGQEAVVTAEELQVELDNQNAGAKTEGKDNNQIEVTFDKSGNVYTVDGGTGEIIGTGNGGSQTPVKPEESELEQARENQTVFEKQTSIKDNDEKNVTIPAKFKIANDSANLVAEGVVIEDLKGNQFVWVPVDYINEFVRTAGYSNGSQDSLTGYTEPFTNGYSTEANEYNAMYNSVKNNKGFYIGRFEAGKDSAGNVVVKKGADVYNNVPWGNSMNDIEGTSQTGGKVGAVKLAKEFATTNKYQGVTSTLCYGIQWDATMQFMDSNYINGSCAEDSYVRNSEGRGHCNASSPTATGSKPEYAEKNIYDMAGNVMEWTMEAYTTIYRVYRGSIYTSIGKDCSPSSRSRVNPDDFGRGYIGFRVALYL